MWKVVYIFVNISTTKTYKMKKMKTLILFLLATFTMLALAYLYFERIVNRDDFSTVYVTLFTIIFIACVALYFIYMFKLLSKTLNINHNNKNQQES